MNIQSQLLFYINVVNISLYFDLFPRKHFQVQAYNKSSIIIYFPSNMAEEELRIYYNYLYPFETIVRWLTHNKKSQLAHRELSFEYEGSGVERYVTFVDAKAMKTRMIDRYSKVPLKVDAGAIWNRTPEKQSNAKTVERELIFDFDMNDYDDVRTCCSGKKVCTKCWKLLITAVEIIEKSLQEDFGFEKLMFVFSGGRGLHIWVNDKRARELKDSVRKGLVDYLELVTGNVKADSLLAEKVVGMIDHLIWKTKGFDNASKQEIKEYYLRQNSSAHVERSLQILSKHFMEIMIEQDVFEHPKCIELMLKIIGNRNEKLKERVNDAWARSRNRSTQFMFKLMVEQIQRFQRSVMPNDYVLGREPDSKIYRLTFIEEQIMLSFLYPRMDHHVSTMQNHLLKLPFSVHPTSKKISIPLFKRQLYGFDPQKCVNIDELLKALDQLQTDNKVNGNENEAIAKLTRLRQPIEALEEFIQSLE